MTEREQALMDEVAGYGLKLVKLGKFYQVQTIDGQPVTDGDFSLDDVEQWINDDSFIPFDTESEV